MAALIVSTTGVASSPIMPSKRDVLSLLTRDELLAIVDRFELSPHDRRAKDALIEAVASSKKATLGEFLPERTGVAVHWHSSTR